MFLFIEQCCLRYRSDTIQAKFLFKKHSHLHKSYIPVCLRLGLSALVCLRLQTVIGCQSLWSICTQNTWALTLLIIPKGQGCFLFPHYVCVEQMSRLCCLKTETLKGFEDGSTSLSLLPWICLFFFIGLICRDFSLWTLGTPLVIPFFSDCLIYETRNLIKFCNCLVWELTFYY